MIKILIIDDEPLIIKLYKEALATGEFQVISAIRGEDGVEMAKTQKPDLILLDIMMPEPDGIRTLEILKSEEATKSIPVVIFTNLSGKYDASFALGKGAAAYWVKNEIKLDTLGERIKSILKS